MFPIEAGCKVKLHYCITLLDGTVAEASDKDHPLEFQMGDGSLIEGLELTLYGLRSGERQTISLDPREAFGYHSDENIHTMPRTEFSEDFKIDEGMVIGFSTPDGNEVPGTVLKIDEDTLKVDFNHPLASQEIIFEVEILEVSQGDPAPVQH